MNVGVSSACFYPLETDKALIALGENAVKCCELFFNTSCELHSRGLDELCSIVRAYEMKVCAVHPFTSFGEGYFLFSKYRPRFLDMLENYKYYFAAAERLGARVLVLHGAKLPLCIDVEQYAERYLALCEAAEDYGVTVAHENVVHCVGERPEFFEQLSRLTDGRLRLVLDLKQARRSDVCYMQYLKRFEKQIVHFHLSDFNESADCCLPQRSGLFDFKAFFEYLKDAGHEGSCVLEVYSDSFSSHSELFSSFDYLTSIYNSVNKNGQRK